MEFTKNVAELIRYIFARGYFCTFGEVFRTKEQAELNAKKGIGIANSLHCKRLAVDLNLFDHDKSYLADVMDYKDFGNYWETLNKDNRWGGKFKNADGNHFEMKDE